MSAHRAMYALLASAGFRGAVRVPSRRHWLSRAGAAAAMALLLAGARPAGAQWPQPLPKAGPCPPGYVSSGDYCKPGRQARPALPRQGRCPPGYSTAGNYCLAGRGARDAIPRLGRCPAGYSTAGQYCLAAAGRGGQARDPQQAGSQR